MLWLHPYVGESVRIETPDGLFSVTLLDVPANHKAILRITGLWRTMLRTCGLRRPVLLSLPSGDLRIDAKVLHVHSRATLGFDAPN